MSAIAAEDVDNKKEGLSKKELNKLARKEKKKGGGGSDSSSSTAAATADDSSKSRYSVLFSKSAPPTMTRSVELYLTTLLGHLPIAPALSVRYCINKGPQALQPLLFTDSSVSSQPATTTTTTTAESGSISGDAAIARFLVRSAAVAAEFAAVSALRPTSSTSSSTASTAAVAAAEEAVGALYGRDDAWLSSQIDQWIDQATAMRCTAPSNAALMQFMALLDAHLADKTFLVGFDLSLADVAVHCCLLSSNSSDTGVLVAQALQEQYTHAFRWFQMTTELLLPPLGVSAAIPVSFSPSANAIAAAAAGAGITAVATAATTTATTTATSTSTASTATITAEGKGSKGKSKADQDGGDKNEAQCEGDTGSCPALEGAVEGAVVTRFPPEPSGYLHIGHAKACLLNQYYAERYKGQLLLRFDDTNPSKEKEEFQQNIMTDLATLGVKPHKVSHSSDHFEKLQEAARKMLKEGKAYMDNTDQETMQAERMSHTESKHRNSSVEENLKWFEELLLGSKEGRTYCLRAKIDMNSVNGTMRDPVLYRFNDTPHHRTGSKYKAYPTYDFACPLIDAWEGVTHALRTTEYNDRDEQYHFLQQAAGVRHVHIHAFGKMNFIHTVLSKRKLAWFVEQGKVEGWFDPRFPTIQGIVRRGVNVDALKSFIVSQGASRRVITMEWDKFWSENKKVLEETAPRFMGVTCNAMVQLHISNAPDHITCHSVAVHPQKPEMGNRVMRRFNKVYIDQQDAATYKVGDEVTLLRWGNVTITEIERISVNHSPHQHTSTSGTSDSASGSSDGARGGEGVMQVLSLKGTYDPDATNFSKTKKLTWVAAIPDLVPCKLVEFDHLISKAKLGEDDKFQDYLNPVTRIESDALCDPCLRYVSAGTVLQLERKGFFRCDKSYGGSADQPAVLFQIPDGKARSISPLNNKGGTTAGATATGNTTGGKKKSKK